jgi:hypothetical protein
MGLLTNSDWGTTPLQRTLAAGIKRVSLGDVRELQRKEGDNKGPKCKNLINLTLEEPAQTTEGETVAAGFPFVVTINEWEGRDEEKSRAQQREFALAVLGKERNSKEDAVAAVVAAGGFSALKGRHLLVEVGVDKGGFQQVKAFNRIPNGAPGAP